MNKHLCTTDADHTPLNARPETVKIRERFNTQSIISKSLAEELGEANKILNWLASQAHTKIDFMDGYFTVSSSGKCMCGYNLREVLLELASK